MNTNLRHLIAIALLAANVVAQAGPFDSIPSGPSLPQPLPMPRPLPDYNKIPGVPVPQKPAQQAPKPVQALNWACADDEATAPVLHDGPRRKNARHLAVTGDDEGCIRGGSMKPIRPIPTPQPRPMVA